MNALLANCLWGYNGTQSISVAVRVLPRDGNFWPALDRFTFCHIIFVLYLLSGWTRHSIVGNTFSGTRLVAICGELYYCGFINLLVFKRPVCMPFISHRPLNNSPSTYVALVNKSHKHGFNTTTTITWSIFGEISDIYFNNCQCHLTVDK